MSRYIDADALFAEFENVGWYNNADRDEIAERLVLQAPTIDAVSVVRCKECKKAHLTYDGDCKYCDEWKDDDDNYITVYHDGDFYCGYGERKESE